MADEPGTAPQEPAKQEPAPGKTFTQEDVDRVVGERLAREREKYSNHDELKAAAERLREIEESNKSELEKATSQRDKFKGEAESKAAEIVRLRVALEKGLTGDRADLVDRLRGNTAEELAADADKLLELVKDKGEPTPEFDGGVREPAPQPSSPEEQHNAAVLQLLGLGPQT